MRQEGSGPFGQRESTIEHFFSLPCLEEFFPEDYWRCFFCIWWLWFWRRWWCCCLICYVAFSRVVRYKSCKISSLATWLKGLTRHLVVYKNSHTHKDQNVLKCVCLIAPSVFQYKCVLLTSQHNASADDSICDLTFNTNERKEENTTFWL